MQHFSFLKTMFGIFKLQTPGNPAYTGEPRLQSMFLAERNIACDFLWWKLASANMQMERNSVGKLCRKAVLFLCFAPLVSMKNFDWTWKVFSDRNLFCWDFNKGFRTLLTFLRLWLTFSTFKTYFWEKPSLKCEKVIVFELLNYIYVLCDLLFTCTLQNPQVFIITLNSQ